MSARNTSSHTYFSHIRKGQITTSNPPLTRCPSRGSSRLPARCGCYKLQFFCPLSSKILLPINLSTHHCHRWTRAKVPRICVVSSPKVPPPWIGNHTWFLRCSLSPNARTFAEWTALTHPSTASFRNRLNTLSRSIQKCSTTKSWQKLKRTGQVCSK